MKRRYDLLIAGHVTHDQLVVRGQESWFTGGGAFFASFAARRAGASVLTLTRLAAADLGLLEPLRAEGAEVVAVPGAATTSIRNLFETDDPDRRKVSLLAQGEAFRLEDFPAPEDCACRACLLTGLFRGEFPDELLEPLSERWPLALDLQGVLRTSRDGVFAWQDWPAKRRLLPRVSYLKADALEAELITGTADRAEAARRLAGWGAREVMITSSSGAALYDGRELAFAPFTPGNLSGRSGRGDTCFGSYLARRLTHGVGDSLRFAAALTSLKMEKPGPFTGSEQQVLARMRAPS
jgi:sugar/nucleoside kinase (ribokinase family)